MDGQPRYQAVWTHDVVIHDDEEVEDDETVVLEMSPTSAFVLIHTLHGAHDAVRATLTIVDNDVPVVTIAADRNSYAEVQGNAGFTLSRTGSTAATLTVTVEVTQQVDRDLLPDGAEAERTVTFAVASATAALRVALENDDLAELPGNLTVRVQAGMGYTVGAPGSATVSVADFDTGRPQPANLTASAGAGVGEVALSWDAHAPQLKFSRHQYRYKTDGNYAAWTDIPNSGQNDSLGGDGSNLTGYTVTGLVGGQLHTFQVRTYSSSSSASDPSDEATATPRSAAVSFGAGSYSVDEGGTVDVTVQLDAAPGREVVVPVSAAGAGGATPPGETGADWSGVPESVTFGATDTEQTFTLAATDDADAETGESVSLSFGTLPAGVTSGTPSEATVTIVDADLPVVTIAADRNSYAEVQGNAGFTLSRTGSTAATLTVTVEVTQQVDRDLLPDGAAAERTVTFAVASATAALRVALENDDLAELPGNLTVRVQAGMGYTVGAPGSATVSVADFDTGRPQPANLTASAGAGVGEVALSWDAHAPQLKFSRHQYRYKTDGNYAAWTDIPNSGQNDSLGGDGSNLTGYTVTGLVGGQLHTFQVRTYSSSSSASDPSDEATATPRSAAVSFGAGSYSVDEGGTVAVTVQLDAAPGREVTVPVSAAGAGGATPPGETGADWSGVPENVTFGATDTEQTFTLAATDDTDVDAGESVALSFGTLPAGVTAGTPSEATVTIVDDDLPVVTIAADRNSYAEVQGNAGFTLSRTGSTAATLTVTVEVTQQVDRDLLPDGAEAERTVTFAVGGATAALTVALENDDLAELPGNLTVRVQAGMGYTVGAPGSATVSVADFDTGRPQPANLTASAGAGVGEVALSWDAHAPQLKFSRHQYRYKTDGNYAAWTDIPNSGQNDSLGGDGSNLTGYTVTGLVGGQLHTFQVRTYSSSSSVSDPSDEATVTPRSAAVSFGAESYSVDEGGTVEVTVQLDAAPGREVVVPVSAAGAGGATPPGETGADWSGVPESVTFGATDTEQTFTLAATDDTDADPGESVALTFGTLPAGVTAGTPSEATVTIVDAGVPVVTIAADKTLVWDFEGTAGFTLSRTGPTAATLTVTVEVTQEVDRDLLPDGAEAERTVMFAVNSAMAALSVALENDDLSELAGDLTVEVQAGMDYTVGDPASATVEVRDGDEGNPQPANLMAEAGVGEVALSWDAHAPHLTFYRHQYRYKTDGNYAAWTDIPNSGQHTGGDGSNLTGYTVTGLVGGQSHTFQVRTHHLKPDGITSVVSDTSNEATATPRSAAVSFGAGSYSVDEGGTVEVTVQLDAAPGREVTVPVSAAGAGGATPPGETGADWSGVPESVTFGAADTEQTFTLAATDDTDADVGESVSLSFGTLPAGVTAGTPSEATVTIVDAALPVVTIAADKSTVFESEGAAGFTLSRTGSTAATLTVTVEVTQQVDRDLLPDGATSERTVTFAVGGATAALSVALDDDDLAEVLGKLTVEVQAGSGYTVGDPASVTVLDLDTGLPKPANLMASAGAEAGEVALSWDAYAPHLQFLRHQYRHKTDGDYAEWTDIPNSGQHTSDGDGSNLTAYTVIGLVGGQVHTFQVRTFNFRSDGITSDASDPSDEATETPRSALVSFGAGSYSVDEGGTVAVTVQLDAAPGREVVVPVSAAGAGGATPPGETGADWSGVPENVTFGATDTEQTFTLAATDDTDVDAGESVALSFGTLPAGVTAGTPSEATVTIVDAALPVVTIAADKTSVLESDGAAGFTLSRTGSTAAALAVTVAVTQQVDRDLLPDGAEADRTVTFAVGSVTMALSVELENDDLSELLGELTVEVLAGMGYTVGAPGSATVTVLDVDTGRPQPANLMAEAGAGAGEVVLSWDAHAPGLSFRRHQYRYKTDGNYAGWTDIPNSGLKPTPKQGMVRT